MFNLFIKISIYSQKTKSICKTTTNFDTHLYKQIAFYCMQKQEENEFVNNIKVRE